MLKKVFDIDNPLMQGLSTVADLMILNLLALTLCLPIVTVGAAATALNDAVQKLQQMSDESVIRMFLNSFRANAKRGIGMGLIYIGAFLLVAANYVAAKAVIPALTFVSLAIGIILLAIGIYAFALLARFDNTVVATLKNAALLTVCYFPRTLIMVIVVVACILLLTRFPAVGVPVFILLGLSLPCYICALIYGPVLKELTEKEA